MKDKRVMFSLKPSEHKALKIRSAATGEPMSKLIAKAVKELMKTPPKEEDNEKEK